MLKVIRCLSRRTLFVTPPKFFNNSFKMSSWLSKGDPCSYSNPEQCKISDIHIDWKVDFSKSILSGYVDIAFERIDPKAEALILDAKDITVVNVRNRNTMKKMPFSMEDPIHTFGSKLEVKLPKTVTKKYVVRIDYETSPKATALQWLEPQQTAMKKHPYVFSQCQAIHARSIVPCQDTPAAKFTYSASVTVPSELTVLMSGINDGEEVTEGSETKTIKFIQKVPIPSYLLAIVVGALESRKIGPRSHVWAENDIIDRAAAEFSETETMLKIAEDILGPYEWGTYDILVLPPSFPFGGMENPCLTFVTPALVVGDKSLVEVIAHEITHSWTGNLVTNNNFEHFWLNEGFTVFVERKITGRMHDEARRHFEALGGWKELIYAIETMGKDNGLTNLIPDLTGIDPDDAFCSVPYEKGSTFLFYLETILGGAEIFEGFLKAYIKKYKFKSLNTDEWKEFLYEYFSDKTDILDKVDWKAWFHTPGMPPIKPDYDTSVADKCIELCKSWVQAGPDELSKFSKKDIEGMIGPQIIEFVALLVEEEPLSQEKIEALNKAYEMEKIMNAEVQLRWIRLALRAKWKPIIPHAIHFATHFGRMKYCRPIYKELYDWEETHDLALSTFKKNVPEMMKISVVCIARDMNVEL